MWRQDQSQVGALSCSPLGLSLRWILQLHGCFSQLSPWPLDLEQSTHLEQEMWRRIFACWHTKKKTWKEGTKALIHRDILTLQFALTLCCVQKNKTTTTNLLTHSSCKDMKSFRITFQCCLPQHSCIPLLISTCSKGSTPLNFFSYTQSRLYKIFTTKTANSPCWPDKSLLLWLWRGTGIKQSPDQREYLPPAASAAASKCFSDTPLSAAPLPGIQ